MIKNAGDGPPPGLVGLSVAVRAPGRWSSGGGLLGAIWADAGLLADGLGGQWFGGNSAVFNQLLTTFLVIAMVWRLTVFWLCSKGYSRRALHGR